MTDVVSSETGAAMIGCELAWRRDGANWVLLHKRRRMGRVVADSEHPGMWRSVKSGGRLSDVANLSWAKDGALAAATRELEWEAKHRAIDLAKCPGNVGCFAPTAPPIRFEDSPLATIPSTINANLEKSLTAQSSR